MSARAIGAVAGVEFVKLRGQIKTYVVLAACVIGPFAFAAAIRLQSSLPSDTLFGRAAKESGFAVPLVLLGFAALWAFPVLTSIVGGDLFSAEDRYGTWKLVLTRGCSRADVFAGKVIAAVAASVLVIVAFAASSIAAGLLVIGNDPLIDLSGISLSHDRAWSRVVLAWTSILAPSLAFTAFAVLLSVISRNSVIGVGLPVVIGLVMQLGAMLDGPEVFRRLLITSAFGAWHGLFVQPSYYGPLFDGIVLSGACFVLCLALAFRSLRRRDIAG
jgi:ABC-2 type transport system permease protein